MMNPATAAAGSLPDWEAPFKTIGQLEAQARQAMEPGAWAYCMGASASEETYRRNRRAIERWAIEQRVLVDVRNVDLSVDFLGLKLPMPVITAPMGSLFRFCDHGDVAIAQGASRNGVLSTVSGACGWPMEEIAQAGDPLVFQLYHFGQRAWAQERLERVQSCPQYKAICLTVDAAVYSRRDRFIEAGLSRDTGREAVPEPRGPEVDYPARLTWADVDWLRGVSRLPLGLKGIMTAADARIALDHGIDFIWVSNHGGRQLDGGRASIDALQEIAAAVGGRVPLVVDGCFTRGADVVKALALGATAVAMGRAMAWALAVGGADGVTAALRLLKEEIRIAMALSGNTSIGQLSAASVHRVDY